MPESFIKFGFSAGVMDPKLHGRGDLKNYDLGLAEARNWCIDYLGGAFTRPGSEYRETANGDVNLPARIIPFQFNNDIANTYLIVITSAGIRFLQDGNYVLDGSLPYQVPTPYSAADLPLLKYFQDGDAIYLTHPSYVERKLTRISAANWVLPFTPYTGYTGQITGLGGTASALGTAGVVFAVTPVDEEGREGTLGLTSIVLSNTSVNYARTAGHFDVAWFPLAGAVSYNVYRSLIEANGPAIHFGMDLGFVGATIGAYFTDSNITPDFTRAPLEIENPFAPGGITTISMSVNGSGYLANAATVSVSGGGGSGFVGRPIVSNGNIVGVRILNPGSGYANPVVTFGNGGFGGSGATGVATASPVSGVFPACMGKVQQRLVRAGTNNNPLGIYGSRVGQPDSYATSGFGRADDPYILTIDSETQTPIRHIIPGTEGFFAFCDDGVFLVRGVDDSAVTITSAKSSAQTAEGAAHIRPLKIDREILYITSESDSIQAIGPSNLPTYFTTNDRSILASHYFSADNPIVGWTWAKAPHKMIWAAREDGTFLSCAYVVNQEVFAWSDHSTKGYVEDFATVRENGFDRVYLLVRRLVGGTYQRFIERLSLQEPETEEEMWAVDSGVRSALTNPAAGVTVSALTGTITVTATAGIFGAGDLGKCFRAGGGRGVVIASPSATQLTVELDIDIRQKIPELQTAIFSPGDWSLTAKFSSFSGLSHLEGETVEILADGAEVQTAVVTGGAITLAEPASLVLAGLGFTGKLKTLPPSISGAVLENREKNVKGVAVRLFKARGLEFGDGVGDITYPLPPRGFETYGVAPRFKEGLYDISIRAGYDFDGAITIHKFGPQSASVLGLVLETEIEA